MSRDTRMRNDDLALCLWAHDVWGGISRKPLEIKTWVQRTTNRKWPIPVIRPVLEYGCAVWYHGLTVAQSQKLESLQKRVSENHLPNCMWYAVWVRVCICWCTAPLCSEIWIGEEVLSLHHTTRELFTRPSPPTAWFRNSFPASATLCLPNTTNQD